MKRKDFIKNSALLTASLAIGTSLTNCRPSQNISKNGDKADKNNAAKGEKLATEFSLPALEYAFDALVPYIDKQTMEIHHGKHHAAYVANLNKAVATNASFAGKNISEICASVSTAADNLAIRNNGGGHYNHSLFWQILANPTTNSQKNPPDKLLAAINSAFGSVENLQKLLKEAALGQFGSGWAWLAVNKDKKLFVSSTANQDNPLMKNIVAADKQGTPILGIDVWEHAYYLNYQNKRKDYVEAIFNLIKWEEVSKKFEAAIL